VFQRNHPGVSKLQDKSDAGKSQGAQDNKQLENFRKGLGIGQTGVSKSQLEVFKRNHPGVKFEDKQ